MTQAQFARWLGVSIKQVKYLEHQRRNPGGPTQRLLDILEYQLSAGGAAAIQVLGASLTERKSPEQPPAVTNGDNGDPSAPIDKSPDSPAAQRDSKDSTSIPDDEAFVWS